MKKVLSSKGIFSITNSLYESIKKNNPELLLEDIWNHTGSDDSGMNMFIINSLVDDIFKNEKNKNKRSINSIKQKVENIYKNKERNSLNVLDAFDDAKDYLYKVKKEYDEFKSMEDDKKNNEQNERTDNNSNNTSVDNLQRNNEENNIENQQIQNDDKSDIKKIDEEFENYIDNFSYGDSMDGFFNIIKDILKLYLPEQYINNALNRYKKEIRNSFSDDEYINVNDKTRRYIENMKDIYDKVKSDCNRLKKLIIKVKTNNNENTNNGE